MNNDKPITILTVMFNVGGVNLKTGTTHKQADLEQEIDSKYNTESNGMASINGIDSDGSKSLIKIPVDSILFYVIEDAKTPSGIMRVPADQMPGNKSPLRSM